MSAIKFRKRLTKFKITIALPKKFGSKGFITVVKVIKIGGLFYEAICCVSFCVSFCSCVFQSF